MNNNKDAKITANIPSGIPTIVNIRKIPIIFNESPDINSDNKL